AFVAVAAALVGAALFLLGPARGAVFSTAEAGSHEGAAVVLDIEKEVELEKETDDPTKLAELLPRLHVDTQERATLPGVERLAAPRAAIKGRLESVRKVARGALESEQESLLARARFAAAIDLATSDPRIARYGLEAFARDLATKARALLAERGEVYVP